MNKLALQRHAQEIAEESQTKEAQLKAGRISKAEYKAFIERAHTEVEEIQSDLKSWDQAKRFSGATELNLPVSQLAPADGGRIMAPSPMDMTAQQVQGLMDAAQARTPYSIEIKPKSFREGIQTKAAVTEAGIGGSFGGQLPPVQSLYAVGLGYEPTRIADLLPGAQMPGPSATWLTHVSNTNEAGIAAEGTSKVDLGSVIAEHQVVPTKIAGTATVTLEAWQDTEKYGEGSFAQWLPTELTRSLINEESSVLLSAVNGTGGATFSGILNTAGTLTRSMGTDSPLDCLAKSYADVRVGAAFADPDLVLIHPNTLSALRRAKDAEGRYLLDLLAGPLNLTAYGQPSSGGPAGEPNPYSIVPQGTNGHSGNLWGASIVTTTQVPAGTAVVMSVKAGAGIFWQRLGLLIFFNPWSLMQSNEYYWVAEERIAFACPRPAAINLVTGLPTI
jgi:HK97 family phage major capsid protein